MTYKKKYKITGKIISKIDIVNMVTNILEKYSKEKELSVKIEAQFKDGTSIVDNDVYVFEHRYFEKLLLEKIWIYIKYQYSDEIRITIYSNNIYSDAEIESHDSNLYNSVCHSIEESLKLMNNQKKVYMLSSEVWGYFVTFIASVMIELILILILDGVFKFKLPSAIIYLMLLMFPSIIAIYTTNYIEKVYPVNQFYFGESSINKPKTEKGFIYKFIMFVITNIVLPIIISLFVGQ